MNDKIRVSFIGMESTTALEKYALEKFGKREHLYEVVTSLDLSLIQHVNHRGVAKDFELVATAKVPKTLIKVSETGDDMYALIDSTSDKIFRSLKRYMDKLSNWEGSKDWEAIEGGEFDDVEVEEELTSYSDYKPRILSRREIEYISPMEDAEAVERMELLGRDHLLYKSSRTGKISLIFRIEGKGYNIEEFPETV